MDFKRYHSTPNSYYYIRRTSDTLCKEHGLSVLTPTKTKGKEYNEYVADKQGTSWKTQLRKNIDRCIIQAKDWDEFLSLMAEMKYEIKYGKYISFRADGQELGTLVQPPPAGEKIAIAGRVWEVEEVDPKRHIVWCRLTEGRVPAFFGCNRGK